MVLKVQLKLEQTIVSFCCVPVAYYLLNSEQAWRIRSVRKIVRMSANSCCFCKSPFDAKKWKRRWLRQFCEQLRSK